MLAGIALETNAAILVRKTQGCMYGVGMFTERDAYDLAVAAEHDPAALRAALSALTDDERTYIARELSMSKQWDQPEKQLLAPAHRDIASNLRAAAVEVPAHTMDAEARAAPRQDGDVPTGSTNTPSRPQDQSALAPGDGAGSVEAAGRGQRFATATAYFATD